MMVHYTRIMTYLALMSYGSTHPLRVLSKQDAGDETDNSSDSNQEVQHIH